MSPENKDSGLRKRSTTAAAGSKSGQEKSPSSSSSSSSVPVHPDANKRYRKKKQLPPVADLLAYGAEETRGQAKTWTELIGYPLILSLLFFVSLVIFHHAPHDKSRGRSNFAMNQKPRRRPPGMVKKQPIVPETAASEED